MIQFCWLELFFRSIFAAACLRALLYNLCACWQCHASEIEKLNSNLSEKIKECKRLKNSFDVLKNQNDELKSQVGASFTYQIKTDFFIYNVWPLQTLFRKWHKLTVGAAKFEVQLVG